MKHSSANLTELRLAEVGLLTDEWLPHLAQLTKLEYLDLSFPSESLTDDPVIALLASIGPGLKHLNLNGHALLTDRVLADGIAPHTAVLASLSMSTLELLTDAGVADFFSAGMKERPPLTSLNLTRDHALAADALLALLAHSGSELQDMKINSWKDTSNEALMDLAKQLPKIRTLDVGWCREVDDFVVKSLLDTCAHLTTLSCHGCNRVTENCPRKVSCCPMS